MRTKKEVYQQEQIEIVDKILEILALNDDKKITLYELDNDFEKQEKIINLIPIIRKYYSFNNIKAVGEPEKIKRPWLSIIKQLCKVRYKITRKDHRIYKDDGIVIRTILYHFQDININKH